MTDEQVRELKRIADQGLALVNERPVKPGNKQRMQQLLRELSVIVYANGHGDPQPCQN